MARRGSGGLVSGLAPLVAGTDTVWLAAAMTDGDRRVAGGSVLEAEGFRVRLLDLDPDDFAMAYDVVCNATLWFVHHGLFDLARRPRFDHRFSEAWEAYRSVNVAFADAVVESAPTGAVVLVQDYHLSLLGPMLADRRPDLRIVHFSHTPFAGPDLMRVLPDRVAHELLEGLAAHHACGFHSARWADAFTDSCEQIIGRSPTTFVAPLATDPDDIRRRRRLRGLPIGLPRARRPARRPVAHHPRRPHRAVEEHRPWLPRVRRPAAPPSRMA